MGTADINNLNENKVTVTADIRKKVLIRIILFSLFTLIEWNMAYAIVEAANILILLRIWKWYREGGHSVQSFLVIEFFCISALSSIEAAFAISDAVMAVLAVASRIFLCGMVVLIAFMIFCYFYSARMVEN